MHRVFALFALAIGFCLVPSAAIAQSIDLPSVDPSACVIDPIEFAPPGEDGDLNMATPVPTPIATVPSQPADADVADLIVARIAQSIACQNAGDLPRMLANFSSAWLVDRFSGYDRVFLQRFNDASAVALPLAQDDRIELVAVDDIRVRDDGVALALVTTRQRDAERTSLLALVWIDDQWLIDSGQPLVTD